MPTHYESNPRFESPRGRGERKEREEKERIAGLTEEEAKRELEAEREGKAAESSGSWKVGNSIRKHPIAFIIILAYYEFPVLAIMGLAPPGEWIGLLLLQFAKAWLFTWVLASIVGRLKGKKSTEEKHE